MNFIKHVMLQRGLLFVLLIVRINCLATDSSVTFPVFLDFGWQNFIQTAKTMRIDEGGGILPQADQFDCSDEKNSLVQFVSEASFSEFFVFSRDQLLMILDMNLDRMPIFMRIDLGYWYNPIRREFEQLARGISGRAKSVSHYPNLLPWQTNWMALYFTPREFNFSLSSLSSYRYKLKQVNTVDEPRPDFWRLIDAATDIEISIPHFEDEELFINLSQKILDQQARISVKTITSNFSAPWITVEQKHSTYASLLPFPYVIGRSLTLTEALLDGRNRKYVDETLLTSDFIFIFSLTPGNPYADLPNVNHANGFVFLLRGDINELLGQIRRLEENLPRQDSQKLDVNIAVDNKPWCSASKSLHDNIGLSPDQCITTLHGVVFSEISDNNNPNDYFTLYNSNDRCVDLDFSQAVVQRDSRCQIAQGKITGKHSLSGVIPARSSLVFGEQGNGLDIPEQLASSFSINGSSYCLALTASTHSIRSINDLQIFDFVAIGDAGDSNALDIASPFMRGQTLVRQCSKKNKPLWQVMEDHNPNTNDLSSCFLPL